MKNSFDEVRNALFHAQNCFEFWWLLRGSHDHRSNVVRAFEDFPLVYDTLRAALYTSFVIKICSIFGTGANDITLQSLPDAESDREFRRIWEMGRRLYKLRSKLITHLDSRCDPDMVAQETGFTQSGLRVFLGDSVALFNRIAKLHSLAGVAAFDIERELLGFLSRMQHECKFADCS